MTGITKVPANEFSPVTAQIGTASKLPEIAWGEPVRADGARARIARHLPIRAILAEFDERGRQIG